ncbi:gluconolaconase [Undibacterium sp. Jales W-56]|uniref:NHL repeat-containing protein n=1 Tax=Undibacterium sp. Jales W-56 TaxID=2897325 RepID=UPI0021D0F780|nr:NHL repeat-containing protein [Undibacterium sp. Jales W-56]MCU6434671.1 gluconolaconase [Undibacterium sp. Jales W-56]
MSLKKSQFRLISGAILGLALVCGYVFFQDSGSVGKLKEQFGRPAAAPADLLASPVAQIVFAGDGLAGLKDAESGVARFSDPYGVVLDASGNTYVSDAGDNNRIRKISPQGQVTSLAGEREGYADGLGAAASFNTPSGLAIDAAGNLLVADTGNNAIRKITPQGLVSTVAGTGVAGFQDGPAKTAMFNGPIGVAADQSGNVYVADTYNDRIRRISPDGQVTTIAGSRPGYSDGIGMDALLDTPCAVMVDPQGELLIADTRNNAVRRIDRDGMVSTVVRSLAEDKEALLKRPVALALSRQGVLFIAEMRNGRILSWTPDRQIQALAGKESDIGFGRPVGMAFQKNGDLLVADANAYAIQKLLNFSASTDSSLNALHQRQEKSLSTPAANKLPWPLKPQHARHEVVGVVGEVRGNFKGESRDHLHNGLDVQGDMGASVLAVMDEKISDPMPNWGFGELSEGLAINKMSYIHMRVGRSIRDVSIDPEKFTQIISPDGKLERIRVKRGTRFTSGDVVGTINRMFHVHLAYQEFGRYRNPFIFSFDGFLDRVVPVIDEIQVLDPNGKPFAKARDGRVHIAKAASELGIAVDAHDKIDGNTARRRLGLYQVGYQILGKDGSALPGYEQPLINLDFSQLPADNDAVKIAYAPNSGITAHGNAETRFNYMVTNIVRDGMAKTGRWRIADLPAGEYVIRVFAADYAGNIATKGTDLTVTIE